VRQHFGRYGTSVAAGLRMRHDHGSPFMCDDFQKELRFRGIESRPAFVRAPEINGCMERFFRTLHQQLLWVSSFKDAEAVRKAVAAEIAIYNENWRIDRHGTRPPAAARREKLAIKLSARYPQTTVQK